MITVTFTKGNIPSALAGQLTYTFETQDEFDAWLKKNDQLILKPTNTGAELTFTNYTKTIDLRRLATNESTDLFSLQQAQRSQANEQSTFDRNIATNASNLTRIDAAKEKTATAQTAYDTAKSIADALRVEIANKDTATISIS